MRRSGIALVLTGAAVVVSAAIPLVTASAADAPGADLGSFSMSASAPAVSLDVSEPNFCFMSVASTQGCAGLLPEATSSLASGPIGSASADIVWPGELGANAGSLIITAGGSSVPTSFEMLNDPVRAQAKTGQEPSTVTYDSVPNTEMKAVAKDALTSADADLKDLSISAAGTIGAVGGHTSTALTGPKQATSKAMSQLSDINLAAGLVHIGGITSTATATSDGTTAKVTGTTTVSNVTVAGIPVTIDQNGVSVMGQGAAISTLTNTVNSALSRAGVTLLVSQPQGKPVGNAVSYSSGAVVFVVTPTKGYQVELTLGQANVQTTASPSFNVPIFGGTTGGTTGVTPVTTTGGGTTGGTTGASAPIGSGSTGAIAPVSTTGGGSTGSVPPPTLSTPTTGGAITPVLADEHVKLGGGLSPWLVVVGLLGVGLMVAGMKRLPDRVLEAVPPVCPLEESP